MTAFIYTSQIAVMMWQPLVWYFAPEKFLEA